MPKENKKTTDSTVFEETFDFEQALEELETLIEQLESDGISLQASLQLFEKGINLTRQCQTYLADAEQKVMQLSEQDGSFQLSAVDFDPALDVDSGIDVEL